MSTQSSTCLRLLSAGIKGGTTMALTSTAAAYNSCTPSENLAKDSAHNFCLF